MNWQLLSCNKPIKGFKVIRVLRVLKVLKVSIYYKLSTINFQL